MRERERFGGRGKCFSRSFSFLCTVVFFVAGCSRDTSRRVRAKKKPRETDTCCLIINITSCVNLDRRFCHFAKQSDPSSLFPLSRECPPVLSNVSTERREEVSSPRAENLRARARDCNFYIDVLIVILYRVHAFACKREKCMSEG